MKQVSNLLKYELEFEINDLPKTTNAFKRQHWIHRHKEAQKWKRAVYSAVNERKPGRSLQSAKLNLVRYSSKCPDSDGLVSSFKHVIDGLVAAQIIVDDSYANIGMPEYRWEKAPKGKGKIKVKVESIE